MGVKASDPCVIRHWRQVFDGAVIYCHVAEQVLSLVGCVLLVVVCSLARCADGYVAGCTWKVQIVKTSDADKHDATVVHHVTPRAPLVDVTKAVRNLTITGIKMDDQVDCNM